MNTSQFIGFMQSPEFLGKDAGAQLNNLTREFPYFQTAQLLYVKSLHNESSFLYNNQLKIAAAYAVNRRVLYELITRKPADDAVTEKTEVQAATTQLTTPVTEVPVTLPEAKTELQPETVKPTNETSTPPTLKDKLRDEKGEWDESVLRQLQLLRHWQNDPESGAPFIQNRKTESPAEEKKVLTEEKTAAPEIPVPPVTAAEEMQEILTVLIDSGEEDAETVIEEITVDPVTVQDEPETELEYEITALVTEEPETAETPFVKPEDPVTQEIISKAIGASIEMEVSDELPSPEELQPALTAETTVEPEAEVNEEDPALSDSPMSFAQWLKAVNRKAQEQGLSGAEQGTANEEGQDDLITRFILEEPRLKPQRGEFYSPVNMAKKSVTEDTEMVTETLAKIYEKQGNIPKAIRAYQKLSLKYPEKSLYFASLIENLKKTPNKNSK